MLFALFGKKPKPRGFSYVPRYYDPEKEKDRAERMRMDKEVWDRKYARVSRGMNPFVMALMAVIVVLLIYVLHQGRSEIRTAGDFVLTPADVPVETIPVEGQTP